jgi:hypothetical protein
MIMVLPKPIYGLCHKCPFAKAPGYITAMSSFKVTMTIKVALIITQSLRVAC